jgi:4-alpha-glucanotransferase
MIHRPHLRELADRVGILPHYTAASTGEERRTSDATRVELLAAMGLDASTEATSLQALRDIVEGEKRRLVEPVQVATQEGAAGEVTVRLPAGDAAPIEWSLELDTEEGRTERAEGRVASRDERTGLRLSIPGTPLRPGYHSLRVAVERSGRRYQAQQTRIVAPSRCTTVEERIGEHRAFGLWANLYSVRSPGTWGTGDAGDLRALLELAAEQGAAFVGVNPLHALWNRGEHVSPYSPISRLHRSLLYLEMASVPELCFCPVAQERIASPQFVRRLKRFRAATHIDYDEVAKAKREILELLHETFTAQERDADTPRGRAYRRFLEGGGRALQNFATFLALTEYLEPTTEEEGWRRWPPPYRHPDSVAVRRFREDHRKSVDFHCWVQFELDRQLAEAAGAARALGLPIGIYGDLAIGSSAGGSDAWAFPDLFADGSNVGAPPDDFARSGQDWGFPPIDPHRLSAQSYGYWIQMLRSAFAHTGALRIDHIMGLFRLYWIPSGRPATEGAYVRYPARELLGILALESQRAGALVIGEDLGTVPRGLAARLARWGILSSRVLYFERRRGSFRASKRYSRRALVTANTHDLAPLAGFLSGSDLQLRREVGQIATDEELDTLRRQRASDCDALRSRLANEDLLPADPAPLRTDQFASAVTAFLCRTPAPLVGLSLDDLVGETEPVNLPGVASSQHRSWTRRMRVPLDQLPSHPVACASLQAVPPQRRMGGERRRDGPR